MKDPRTHSLACRLRFIAIGLTLLITASGCSSEAIAQTNRQLRADAPVSDEGANADHDATKYSETEVDVIEAPQDRGGLDGPVVPVEQRGDRATNEYLEEVETGPPLLPETPEHEGSTETPCDFEYLGNDLTSNRGNGLPTNRLQVVLFYDGDPDSSPELTIGLTNDTNIVVGGERAGGPIETFGRTIETREYQIYGCTPTGWFDVAGTVPNGVIDGLAFAMWWRDSNGSYTMLKSVPSSPNSGATYVGMWPLGFSRESFAERTAEITDNFARESARGLIIGAGLTSNGEYVVPLPTS